MSDNPAASSGTKPSVDISKYDIVWETMEDMEKCNEFEDDDCSCVEEREGQVGFVQDVEGEYTCMYIDGWGIWQWDDPILLEESSSSTVIKSSSSAGPGPSVKLESFTDARDGQSYKMVKIGTQTWMAENLNFNSNFLPEGAADSVYNSFCFGDDDANCEKLGRLYL